MQDVWTDIEFKVAREAAIKGEKLISGHAVRICKLKMQNKSAFVWEGAGQGAQCKTKKHEIRRQRHSAK